MSYIPLPGCFFLRLHMIKSAYKSYKINIWQCLPSLGLLLRLCRIKAKVTVGLQKCPHLPQYTLLGPYNVNFEKARKPKVSMYVHHTVIYKV